MGMSKFYLFIYLFVLVGANHAAPLVTFITTDVNEAYSNHFVLLLLFFQCQHQWSWREGPRGHMVGSGG